MTAGKTEGVRRWELHCRDIVDRQRRMKILLAPDRIVLTAPPGESAVLDWQTAEELRRLLRQGAVMILNAV